MNLDTHNRYFRDIAYNTDKSVGWSSSGNKGSTSSAMEALGHRKPPYMKAETASYEYRVAELIKGCTHVHRVEDLAAVNGDAVLCLWFDVDPTSERNPPPFEPISSFFGLWHEHRRGSHKGLHEFYWYGNYVLLLNVHNTKQGSYQSLMPAGTPLLDPKAFGQKDLALAVALKDKHIQPVVATKLDESCDQVSMYK
jgi:hypothetical protein